MDFHTSLSFHGCFFILCVLLFFLLFAFLQFSCYAASRCRWQREENLIEFSAYSFNSTCWRKHFPNFLRRHHLRQQHKLFFFAAPAINSLFFPSPRGINTFLSRATRKKLLTKLTTSTNIALFLPSCCKFVCIFPPTSIL